MEIVNKGGTIKKKHAGGRPSIMTEFVLGKLEHAFSYGLTDEEACHYAGINPTTYYDYIKKNPEFSKRVQALKQRPIMLARITLVNSFTTRKIKKLDRFGNVVEVDVLGNPHIALKYLERKRKEEFSPYAKIEQPKQDNTDIKELTSKIDEILKLPDNNKPES